MSAAMLSALTFLAVFSGLTVLFMKLDTRHRRAMIVRRIRESAAPAGLLPGASFTPLRRFTRKLGRLAMPGDARETASTRRMLTLAGYRSGNAVLYYFGLRIGLSLLLGIVYLLVALPSAGPNPRMLLFTFFPLAAGYYLPGVLLKSAVSRRRRKIFRELPDALDLLLICIESGLSFDTALHRVGNELSEICPILSSEFGQYFLEIKGGLQRKTALQNLIDRNDADSLTSVAGVFLQSARFGTNMSDALKTYIRSMRTERSQNAEERAARLSTHLTFPLVALILPALFFIILGPALINILNRFQGGF